jgi:DNA-directed RNA polymerase I subunit RPA43
VGIDQEMTAQLMQYSEKLQGVILSFSNVKLERPVGAIMNEQPYIHCKVLADALVFRPREGMILEGVVNKIGSNHIGMLFAGVFNGSVAASELPKGYVHNYAQDAWYGIASRSVLM